jgi:predicted secreted protein
MTCRLTRLFAAPLVVATLFALPAVAHAGDAAARRIIGFSPDGGVFAFEQYTQLYDATDIVAEIQAIDTRTDSFVKGTPIVIATGPEDEREVETVRADLAAKAKPVLERLRVTEPGQRIAGRPSMDLDEIGIYQMDPQPLATRLAFPLPDGRNAVLTLSDRALGKASCYGAGGRGAFGDVIVTGLRLHLAIDGGATKVLQEDSRLPKRRRCVTAYGIAEAHIHRAADGAQTLAVLIETVDAHEFHAGPNRRFMAVTHRLGPK